MHVWTTFARDAGIERITIAFTRVLRDDVVGVTKEVPARQRPNKIAPLE